ALTPPTPLPEGASFPQGLVQFRLEGLATLGAAVTVTQTFHGGLSSGLTFYKHGSAAPGAAVTYYPFMYDPPASPTGAEFILAENKIVLHLKDGALGDDDWTENGVILDAGGPALVSVEPVALSISQLTATTAEISWPASAGTLVLRYADSLASPVTWERDDHPAEVSGDRKRVTVELVGGTRFYSLGAP
ncbi:MAG: hypothetical protein HYY24_25905, partial [Verrucomicrobia bacterium]|nr:hypothetical protein [Verrucomicrobiota bacterium]